MIHVLPGMGADSTMFSGRWRTLPDCRFIDWPPYQGERTIAEIAKSVIAANPISDGDTLIGTSLGGIVASEISRLKNLRQLILVGSALHPEEINSLLILLHPLARIAPLDLFQWSSGKIPHEISQMFSESQVPFIRAACEAIFLWQGLDTSLITPLRIHGKNDLVIPAPAHVDLLLDGGHLIAMTHADACCVFIESVC